jgi:hypothetical protein
MPVMGTGVVLCQGGLDCPGRVTLYRENDGHLHLVFEEEDGETHSLGCSLTALVNVGLGACTHLGWKNGLCKICRIGAAVIVELKGWDGRSLSFKVRLDDYVDAISSLALSEQRRSYAEVL